MARLTLETSFPWIAVQVANTCFGNKIWAWEAKVFLTCVKHTFSLKEIRFVSTTMFCSLTLLRWDMSQSRSQHLLNEQFFNRLIPKLNSRFLKNKLPIDPTTQAAGSRFPFPCIQMTLPTKINNAPNQQAKQVGRDRVVCTMCWQCNYIGHFVSFLAKDWAALLTS